MGERTQGVLGRVAENWRAFALAACTLWSNMLLFSAPLPERPDETAFAIRALTMLTSVAGFAAAFAVARRRGGVGTQRPLLATMAVLASIGTGAHLVGGASLPPAADAAAVGVYSICFAFLLVACGETYARLEPFEALAFAGGSYLLGWACCSAVDLLPRELGGAITTLMPLVVLAMMPCWGRAQAGDAAANSGTARRAYGSAAMTAGDPKARRQGPQAADEANRASNPQASLATTGSPSRGRAADAAQPQAHRRAMPAQSLHDALSRTRAAIPTRILLGLGVTHFALGATLAATGVAASPTSFFSPLSVALAVLTSLACVGVALVLKRRVPLVTFYKAALVVQALGVFLLAEASAPAQLATVVAFVGVYIVSWALVAQCAHAGLAVGAAPALAIAAGRLVEQATEGLGVLLAFSDVLDSLMLAAVVAVLLLVAAAFLFTDSLDVAAPAAPAPRSKPQASREVATPDAQAFLDARVAAIAQKYRLSARETEVFELWATGHDLKYLQDKLGLSLSTVKTHVRHIYAKTDTHSRAEVVILLDETTPQG